MEAKIAAEIRRRHEETKPLIGRIEVLLDEMRIPPTVKRYALNIIGMGAIKPEESEAHWRKMDAYFRPEWERSFDWDLGTPN